MTSRVLKPKEKNIKKLKNMQKLKALLVLIILGGGIYFGYNYLNQTTTQEEMTIAEGQELFGQAFLLAQESDNSIQKGGFDAEISLAVKDNKNDVIPTELEKLSGSISLEYDFTNELNASAETLVEFFLNGSKVPNLGFMASLKEKVLSYTLTNFDTDAGVFLGLDELLGGTDELQAIQDALVGQTQNVRLKESEYREIVKTLTHATENSDIVINTDEQDHAILQSFVDEKVVTVTSAEKNAQGYSLSYKINNQSVVDFLRSVAEINGLERDFTSELPVLKQISVTGQIQIGLDQKLQKITGDVLVERSLLNSAEKDLLFGFDYETTNQTDKFVLTLIDSVKNTEQAQLEISVKQN